MDKILDNFALTDAAIQSDLDALAKDCKFINAAVELVGYPAERRRSHGFATLLRVIAGQQLSVKAAATIAGRVEALMDGDPTPEKALALSEEKLRSAGMSRQKITYIHSLADCIKSGMLNLDTLPSMDDTDAIAAITAVKGLGVWSAEMYLMFSLGRTDIWPVDDLAVRAGAGRIIGMKDRPTPKETMKIGERWAGKRSSVALMAWHYYSNAPL